MESGKALLNSIEESYRTGSITTDAYYDLLTQYHKFTGIYISSLYEIACDFCKHELGKGD